MAVTVPRGMRGASSEEKDVGLMEIINQNQRWRIIILFMRTHGFMEYPLLSVCLFDWRHDTKDNSGTRKRNSIDVCPESSLRPPHNLYNNPLSMLVDWPSHTITYSNSNLSNICLWKPTFHLRIGRRINKIYSPHKKWQISKRDLPGFTNYWSENRHHHIAIIGGMMISEGRR